MSLLHLIISTSFSCNPGEACGTVVESTVSACCGVDSVLLISHFEPRDMKVKLKTHFRTMPKAFPIDTARMLMTIILSQKARKFFDLTAAEEIVEFTSER